MSTNASPPKNELKPRAAHLRYVYLGPDLSFPVIISSALSELEEKKLLQVLKTHKAAIGWSIGDIKGINPSVCIHKNLMKEKFKPIVQYQHRLKPNMKYSRKKF